MHEHHPKSVETSAAMHFLSRAECNWHALEAYEYHSSAFVVTTTITLLYENRSEDTKMALLLLLLLATTTHTTTTTTHYYSLLLLFQGGIVLAAYSWEELHSGAWPGSLLMATVVCH